MLAFSLAGAVHLVVQCKGFLDEKLGRSHTKQCLRSIEAFKQSRLRPQMYVLVYNREGRWPEFRRALEGAVAVLEQDRRVGDADVWSIDDLLQVAFNGVLREVRRAVQSGNASYVAPANRDLELEEVPFRRRVLTLDQHRVVAEEVVESPIGRVTSEILLEVQQPPSRQERRGRPSAKPTLYQKTVILGEFGSGKTTAILAAMRILRGHALYVPAAGIPDSTRGAKDLLVQCLDLDRVFETYLDADRERLRTMARPVVFYLLKDPKANTSLILDGLDESAFLAQGGALQTLFNVLREVRVPTLLAMRTEFWDLRRPELDSALGQRGLDPKVQRIKVVEILPWEDAQVASYVERALTAATKPGRKRNLSALRRLVLEGSYEALFGNLPRRPLFLAMLVDWVGEKGLQRVGRAELLCHMAARKIERDVLAPQRLGGSRLSIADAASSVHVTQEIAWLAMKHGACAMTTVVEGRLELTASCLLDQLVARDSRLADIPAEPLRLTLNSLLIADGTPRPGRPVSVRFAHRAFQEYFLAWALLENFDVAGRAPAPPPVREWMAALQNEEVVSSGRP